VFGVFDCVFDCVRNAEKRYTFLPQEKDGVSQRNLFVHDMLVSHGFS